MQYPEFKVCVRCFTYNQAKYITDSMNGFCMQKTDFPFICCIVDDASTDCAQDIIYRYFKENFIESEEFGENEKSSICSEFIGRHKTNANCWFVLFLFHKNQYGKESKYEYINKWAQSTPYEAVCEGDDYWIDCKKLQKQYDLMQEKKDCSLSFHSIKEIYEGRSYLNKIRCNVELREYTGIEWYSNRPAQFASFFFKRDVYKSDIYKEVWTNKKFIARDIPLLLCCASMGKIYGLPDVMSVYRHNDGGWTAQKRSKKQYLKVIESQLAYKYFGSEFENKSIYFAQRDCISAFLHGMKNLHFSYFSFLVLSLKFSVGGTIRALYKVMLKKFD